ncbi:MAG: aldo/keto reductase [Eubacteriales bacterium]|nr:aldo/keto reductase [Eubacteriales bacterium]
MFDLQKEKKLGFGCMRLPMIGEEVDQQEFCRMIDAFMAAGFRYFDTAHGYVSEKSEPALRECLVKRYPRESYLLTDKLSPNYFEKREDILPLFDRQLEAAGVDYFDYYLMHAQNRELHKKYVEKGAYEIVAQLKKQGKIRHMGISFHDKADALDMILTDQPQIEVVQIQFNYMDYDDPGVESKKVYDVCRKHGKPVIIMEPVKGGRLAELPPAGAKILDELHGGTHASYAVRFAASFEGVCMVLSGMSNLAQMEDNLSFMKEFVPLNQEETEAVHTVREVLKKQGDIACTGCRYCMDGCPAGIGIPGLFHAYNHQKQFGSDRGEYKRATTDKAHPSACVDCGQCEDICPQHLPIRKLLQTVQKAFE